MPTPMSNSRARAALAFYGPLADAPSPARRVGWESDDAHRLRLAAVIDALPPLDGLASVLDAGAGEGALLPALRARGFTGAYRGVDVLEHMVAAARARHADDPNATFEVTDAFVAPQPAVPSAEAVVCSGALNTVVDGAAPDAEVAMALTALWARAARVLVVDLAVADRHPPGAGLARADLGRAYACARELAPVVRVSEEAVFGEALLVLSRSRTDALARLLPEPADALARARALLAAGEAEAARTTIGAHGSPEAQLVAALADLRQRELGRAEATLRRLAATPVGATARLHLASVLWLTGRRRAAEALLHELAASSDEARVHLVELLAAQGRREEGARVVDAITDPWMRREADRLLTPPPDSA